MSEPRGQEGRYITYAWVVGILVFSLIGVLGLYTQTVIARQDERASAILLEQKALAGRVDSVERLNTIVQLQAGMLIRIGGAVGLSRQELDAFSRNLESIQNTK